MENVQAQVGLKGEKRKRGEGNEKLDSNINIDIVILIFISDHEWRKITWRLNVNGSSITQVILRISPKMMAPLLSKSPLF